MRLQRLRRSRESGLQIANSKQSNSIAKFPIKAANITTYVTCLLQMIANTRPVLLAWPSALDLESRTCHLLLVTSPQALPAMKGSAVARVSISNTPPWLIRPTAANSSRAAASPPANFSNTLRDRTAAKEVKNEKRAK